MKAEIKLKPLECYLGHGLVTPVLQAKCHCGKPQCRFKQAKAIGYWKQRGGKTTIMGWYHSYEGKEFVKAFGGFPFCDN